MISRVPQSGKQKLKHHLPILIGNGMRPLIQSFLFSPAFVIAAKAVGYHILAGEPTSPSELLQRVRLAEGGKEQWDKVSAVRSVSTRMISLGGKASVKTTEVLERDFHGGRWRLAAEDEKGSQRLTIGNSERTTTYKLQTGKIVGSVDAPPDLPDLSESNKLLRIMNELELSSPTSETKGGWILTSEKDGSQWLIDPNTSFISSRLEKTDYGQSETKFEDYRPVAGVLLPFLITTWVKDADYRIEQRLESIEINPALDEKAFSFDDSWKKIKVGETIPDFEFKDAFVDGKRWNRDSLQGTFTLIDFWATWCGPCVAEFPKLKDINQRFKDSGFVILAVSLDAEEATYRAYVEKNISDWGNVLVQDGFDSEVARKFELSAIPRSILVDPEGKIVAIDDDARGTKLLLLLEKQLRERY